MKKVSVVIPIYNVEKYMKKCINSIINQTYKSLEIILIDDGSTDSSPKICDSFSNKDDRIVVIHKPNEGVSVARNFGLKKASGDYVVFVDSDDWLGESAIEDLVNGISDGDFCTSGMIAVDHRGFRDYVTFKNKEVLSNNSKEYLKFVNQLSGGLLGNMFKRSIIESNNIQFPQGVKLGEDSIFLYKYLKNCTSVKSINKNGYYYNRLVTNSAITKYYEDNADWASQILFEFFNIFNADELDKEIANKIIYSRFINTAKIEYLNLDEKSIEGKINQLQVLYKKSVENFDLLSDESKAFEILNADASKVYDLVKQDYINLPSTKSIKSCIRRFLVGIVRKIRIAKYFS